MSSYFALEGLIIDRLCAELDDSVAVLNANDLAQIQPDTDGGLQQKTPAVHVIHGPDLVDEVRGKSGEQKVTQRWYVVPVVRVSRQGMTGKPARENAGELITNVLNALNGWTPGEGFCKPLKRINGPEDVGEAGYFYYPLLFETDFVTTGVNTK